MCAHLRGPCHSHWNASPQQRYAVDVDIPFRQSLLKSLVVQARLLDSAALCTARGRRLVVARMEAIATSYCNLKLPAKSGSSLGRSCVLAECEPLGVVTTAAYWALVLTAAARALLPDAAACWSLRSLWRQHAQLRALPPALCLVQLQAEGVGARLLQTLTEALTQALHGCTGEWPSRRRSRLM